MAIQRKLLLYWLFLYMVKINKKLIWNGETDFQK